jgi:hypothetical protein
VILAAIENIANTTNDQADAASTTTEKYMNIKYPK